MRSIVALADEGGGAHPPRATPHPQGLLEQLAGERGRWERQLASLAAALATLPREALAAAAFATHAAAAPERARAAALAEWGGALGLPATFSAPRFLASEAEMLAWAAAGLPGDALSLDNGAAALAARGCPFIVDPSSRVRGFDGAAVMGARAARAVQVRVSKAAAPSPYPPRARQAVEWLRAHLAAAVPEGEAPPDVCALHEARFTTALQLAVRFGRVGGGRRQRGAAAAAAVHRPGRRPPPPSLAVPARARARGGGNH